MLSQITGLLGESQNWEEGKKESNQLRGGGEVVWENVLNHLKHVLISHSGASTKWTMLEA